MSARRSVLFTIMLTNMVIAIKMGWTIWNRIAVAASATAVLIDAGQQIAEWVKAEK